MPSSCHNDSNFLFPSLCHVDNSFLLSVSPFLTSPYWAPSFSSVCCLKLSNKNHTKQDGRLDAYLLAILSASPCLSFASFVFLSYSLALHFPHLYLSFPSVVHTFLHPSLSSSLSMLLFFHFSPLISTVVYMFIHPSYSLANHCYHFLLLFYISIPAGPTWKHIGSISSHSF